MQIIMLNATIMIFVSNLHKMHLTLRDDEYWVRVHTTSISSIPPTVGKDSTTQVPIGALEDITIA